MKLPKNHNRVTVYNGTPYEVYQDMKSDMAGIKKFILWNSETKEIVTTTNNPNKLDKLVYSNKKGDS